MSVAALRWARAQRCGSPMLKAVLMMVADYADDDGLAWPSQKTLADDLECAKRSVRDALAGLCDKGLVRRVAVLRDDGSRASDRLYLNLTATNGIGGEPRSPRGEAPAPRGEPRSPQTGSDVPQGGEPRSPREPSLNPQEEPSPSIDAPVGAVDGPKPAPPKARKPKATSEPEGFAAFYEEYPRHVARDAARKAYAAVLRDGRASPAELLAGAERYRRERTGQEDRFTSHPASWLNAGRWQDAATGKQAEPPRSDAERGEGQRAIVRRWKASPQSWPRQMGPPPDQPGCTIPKPILAEFNLP